MPRLREDGVLGATNPSRSPASTRGQCGHQVAQIELPDTTAMRIQPIRLFLPLVTTFADEQTPAANLIYTATLADGSDLSTAGLAFETTPDGAGGVSGGVITGTPRRASAARSTSV